MRGKPLGKSVKGLKAVVDTVKRYGRRKRTISAVKHLDRSLRRVLGTPTRYIAWGSDPLPRQVVSMHESCKSVLRKRAERHARVVHYYRQALALLMDIRKSHLRNPNYTQKAEGAESIYEIAIPISQNPLLGDSVEILKDALAWLYAELARLTRARSWRAAKMEIGKLLSVVQSLANPLFPSRVSAFDKLHQAELRRRYEKLLVKGASHSDDVSRGIAAAVGTRWPVSFFEPDREGEFCVACKQIEPKCKLLGLA
ncbi:hypothetical protein GHT06_003836 [Daphnia sinensis]|uniref:Uncharacterized protein n=1 Tax=Daphnia sinensis TaxID=1820382 RepID=A0AAD5KUA3_9CRUS|nr:hypothetical protein GHT06_003836 [Daphnia sinensis]